ncbi:helix-turn-helix domain-containing protein [Marinomonas transparens]|uniref:Helix-turn-helix transcriptional regulator n=1 Tax=Marinomonas transparens TaxID=2795388 RepID=A0A934N4A6_9GAMM|nr:helix-turn-helix transcriptional regulator [Marinomonas transparens]MBJ7539873.1 helix-turn-helix transcriptional regulator [Marinomonas transparens]
MALSDRLTELRKSKNIPLQVVADAMNVSKTLIHELEKGKTRNPKLATLLGLSDFYGVSLDDLVGYVGNQGKLDVVKAFVSSDSVAITHQSLGQYRSSILRLLS